MITGNKHPADASQRSVGCGLSGCLAGLLLGFLSSALILILLAFYSALDTEVPAIPPPLSSNPDLRIILTEDFVNRFAQQTVGDTVKIDVLPGNRVQILADTTVQAFDLQVPVQVTGLFEIQLVGQSIQVVHVDTQVAGIDLNLGDFFSGDLAIFNQNVQTMFDELTANVGIPVTATELNTTETQILIEVTERP